MNTREIMLELYYQNLRMIDFVNLSSDIQERVINEDQKECANFKIVFIRECLSIRTLYME